MPRVRKNDKWCTIKFEPADVYQARLLHQNGASPWHILQKTGIPYEFMGAILARRMHDNKETTPVGYEPIDESAWTLK